MSETTIPESISSHSESISSHSESVSSSVSSQVQPSAMLLDSYLKQLRLPILGVFAYPPSRINLRAITKSKQ